MTLHMTDTIEDRLGLIKEQICRAAAASGREMSAIKLVAVTKTVPSDRVLAAVSAGVRDLGENYVKAAQAKARELAEINGQPIVWHLIGHLQSNKAKDAVKLFGLIHTVDSLHLATELNYRAQLLGKVQKILIQVNVSGEVTKSGVAPTEVSRLVHKVALLPGLSVQGLMAIPEFFDSPELARPCFAALRALRDQIRDEKILGVQMEELSMGMSGDFEVAIEEGATIVRVGAAIFGQRL